jgi:hypothetical protein
MAAPLSPGASTPVQARLLTPRFPAGIKGSDLAEADEAIQRETMAILYLANLVPATGTYFGFAEAQPEQESALLNASPLNTLPSNLPIVSVVSDKEPGSMETSRRSCFRPSSGKT